MYSWSGNLLDPSELNCSYLTHVTCWNIDCCPKRLILPKFALSSQRCFEQPEIWNTLPVEFLFTSLVVYSPLNLWSPSHLRVLKTLLCVLQTVDNLEAVSCTNLCINCLFLSFNLEVTSTREKFALIYKLIVWTWGPDAAWWQTVHEP